jgi:hypothetical protein
MAYLVAEHWFYCIQVYSKSKSYIIQSGRFLLKTDFTGNGRRKKELGHDNKGANKMKRCTRCILPENYPGIIFNEEGICNYCITYKEREYLGGEALKEKIKASLETKSDRNDNYDCVLALSGGRDSTYLLYYLVKVLNLRVLAYFIDNGFIPEQTKQNVKYRLMFRTSENGR